MLRMCLGLAAVILAQQARAIPNPAAAYCELLGYEYRVIQTATGERGVVVPEPGVEFDAWDFYRGKVGGSYSYGALLGYEVECVRTNIGGYVAEYAACRWPGTDGGDVTRLPLHTLLQQNGLPLLDAEALRGRRPSRGAYTLEREDADFLRIYSLMDGSRSLPAAFDWRDYYGKSFIGPVRDQGACGSCYAFAACAAAEGAYNWATGLHDADCADFSESFIIWCLGRLPEYNSHFYGCDGSDYDYMELTALTTHGVTWETNFPYRQTDPGSCTHMSDPVVIFPSWHRVPCGDIDAIKTAIQTHGVVDAAVYVDSHFQAYAGGIFENDNTDCAATPCYYTPANHAINLVGWDDNPPEGGGGCWILRNSWGTAWGENGYMRIRYTSAAVSCAVCYMTYPSPQERTLTVVSAHGGAVPSAGAHEYPHGMTVTASVTNSPLMVGGNRYVCTGWSGTGSVPSTGLGTNTGPFVIVADSSITWFWKQDVLAAPVGVTATSGNSDTHIAVAWQAVPEAAGYRVWRGMSANPADAVPVAATSATGYIDTDACHGPLYYYRVQATNAAAASDMSASAEGWRAGVFLGSGADFDGDGLADPLIYDESAGAWRIKLSGSGYGQVKVAPAGMGGRGYAAVPADYDGDGLGDLGVYHEETGTWSFLLSGSGYSVAQTLLGNFGGTGYTAIAGDFDGDGRADPALYHRATGDWTVLLSSAGYGPVVLPGWLGGSEARAIPADYDGDGKADPAVYHSQTGLWEFRLSGSEYGYFALPRPLGGTGYLPVPADYDGDGKADPAVRSQAGHDWTVMMSGNQYMPATVSLVFE